MSYRITPKPGLIIRDPEHEGRILSSEGITVNKLNPFWRRRLRDGSITVTENFRDSIPHTRTAGREEV